MTHHDPGSVTQSRSLSGMLSFVLAITGVIVPIAILTGCKDDTATVREIQAARQARQQAATKVDHLGEAIGLVSRLIELESESGGRQILYHLNAWRETQPKIAGQVASKAPALLKTVSEFMPNDQAIEAVKREEFVPLDVYHLRYQYLLREVADWVRDGSPIDPLFEPWLKEKRESLGGENADALATAVKFFDWTIRNIAIEPRVFADQAPPTPPLPLGMQYRGAGYRQTPYRTLFRGTGDSQQRSGLFVSLLRQAGIPAFVLGLADGKGEFSPWVVGVLIGDDVYLFDCELGVPIPGPGQVGIATLADARKDASVLRRMSVQGLFDYPVQKDDVQQCAALLVLEPEAISGRIKRLQEGLTGDLRMVLYDDADATADRLEEIQGIASVRIWDVPLKSRVYNAAIEQICQNDPVVAFFTLAEWTILDGEFDQAKRLALGRWRHLQGIFDEDELSTIKGAKPLYLSQRQPEFEIADLRIDVDLQKQYGIRRDLGVTPEIYDRQIQQVQKIMRQGKNTATFWLSLIQYETERFDLAKNWFQTRVLLDGTDSRWEQSARYNLARSLEELGETDKAIELYKTVGDIQ